MNTKQIIAVSTLVSLLGMVGTAFAGTIITLPANFETDALAYAGDLFTDLSTLILVIIGLPLAFWVVKRVIGLVRARA